MSSLVIFSKIKVNDNVCELMMNIFMKKTKPMSLDVIDHSQWNLSSFYHKTENVFNFRACMLYMLSL